MPVKKPVGKWLPGDLPRDLYICIQAYNSKWKEQKEASGVYECRDERGIIEIQIALNLPTPPPKMDLPPSALWCPGARMFVSIGYSSIHIGQLLVITNTLEDGSKKKRVIRSPTISLYRYYTILVSKAGVYVVNQDPDFYLGPKGRPPEEFPLTEIRMQHPLWVYPSKVQDELRLL